MADLDVGPPESGADIEIPASELFTGAMVRINEDVYKRQTVLLLKALEAQVAQLMTLTLLDGQQREVVWRRPGVVATPLIEMADPEAGEPYALTLNFTEVIR